MSDSRASKPEDRVLNHLRLAYPRALTPRDVSNETWTGVKRAAQVLETLAEQGLAVKSEATHGAYRAAPPSAP